MLSSFNHKMKKILFVNEEHDMTLIFKKALESIGFSVDAFNDSGRARREYRRTPQKRHRQLVHLLGYYLWYRR
jgi:DNA-binding response OmpR family regulator